MALKLRRPPSLKILLFSQPSFRRPGSFGVPSGVTSAGLPPPLFPFSYRRQGPPIPDESSPAPLSNTQSEPGPPTVDHDVFFLFSIISVSVSLRSLFGPPWDCTRVSSLSPPSPIFFPSHPPFFVGLFEGIFLFFFPPSTDLICYPKLGRNPSAPRVNSSSAFPNSSGEPLCEL